MTEKKSLSEKVASHPMGDARKPRLFYFKEDVELAFRLAMQDLSKLLDSCGIMQSRFPERQAYRQAQDVLRKRFGLSEEEKKR